MSYLDELQGKIKANTTQSNTPKSYLEELQGGIDNNDTPVRDWLKSFYGGQQDVNKIEITPAIRKQYESRKNVNPAAQIPEAPSVLDVAGQTAGDILDIPVTVASKFAGDFAKGVGNQARVLGYFADQVLGKPYGSGERPRNAPNEITPASKVPATGFSALSEVVTKPLEKFKAGTDWLAENAGINPQRHPEIAQLAGTVGGVLGSVLPHVWAGPATLTVMGASDAMANQLKEGGQYAQPSEVYNAGFRGGAVGLADSLIFHAAGLPLPAKVSKIVSDMGLTPSQFGRITSAAGFATVEEFNKALETGKISAPTMDTLRSAALAFVLPGNKKGEVDRAEFEKKSKAIEDYLSNQKKIEDDYVAKSKFDAAFEKSMTDNLNREVKPPEVIAATPKPIESKIEPQKPATPPQIDPKKLTHEIQSEPDYVYHATNEDRLFEIADTGELRTHKPGEFTDQGAWPDGSTQNRAYFSNKANTVWQFAPEDGTPVVLRTRGGGLKTESTGDIYSDKPLSATNLEYLGKDDIWHPVSDLKSATEPPNMGKPPIKAEPIPKPRVVELDFEIGDKAIVTNPDNRNKGDYPGEIVGVGELNGVKTFSIKLRKDGSTKIVTADQLSTTKENYYNGMSNQQINEIKSRNKEINEKLWDNPIEFSSTDADYKEFQSLQSNKDKADFILKFHAKRVGIDTFGIDINNPVERIKLFGEIGKLNKAEMVEDRHSTRIVSVAKIVDKTTNDLKNLGQAEIIDYGIATHPQKNVREHAERAHDFVVNNPDKIDDIVNGRPGLPADKLSDELPLSDVDIWFAACNKAAEDGDAVGLLKLAKNSATARKISEAGTTLRTLADLDDSSPLYQIMQVNKEAKVAGERIGKSPKQVEAINRKMADLEKQITEKTTRIEQLENKKIIETFSREVRTSGRKEKKEELAVQFNDLAAQFNKAISNQMNIGLDPAQIKLLGQMAANKFKSGALTVEQIVDDIHLALNKVIDKSLIRGAIVSHVENSSITKREIEIELAAVKREGAKLVSQSPEERQTASVVRYRNYLEKRYAELTRKLTEGDYTTKPRNKTPLDSQMKLTKENVFRLAKVYNNFKRIKETSEGGITVLDAKNIIQIFKVASDRKMLAGDGSNRDPEGPSFNYGRVQYDGLGYVSNLKLKLQHRSWQEIGGHIKEHPIYGTAEELGKGIVKAGGLLKSIKASLDDSALLRQGIKVFWNDVLGSLGKSKYYPQNAHKMWVKSAVKSLGDLVREFGKDTVMRELGADLLSRPNMLNGNYNKGGSKYGKLDMLNMEEAFPEQMHEKMNFPVGKQISRAFKASDVVYTAFVQRNRADLADAMFSTVENMGLPIDAQRAGSICQYANFMTGRGHLKGDHATLNKLFFAPRFLKSNIEFLTAGGGLGLDPMVRKEAAWSLARYAIGTAATLTLFKMLKPNSVEFNVLSAASSKIRDGATYYDISGGMGPLLTFGSRMFMAAISEWNQTVNKELGITKGKPLMATKSSTTGKLAPLTAGNGIAKRGVNVAEQFVEGKLAPAASFVKEWISGQGSNRKPLTLGGMALNLITPLILNDVMEAIKNKDASQLGLVAFADFVGIGVNTYGKGQPKKYKPIKPQPGQPSYLDELLNKK